MHWNSLRSSFLADPEHDFVLVSLISKKGSSYLQPGARMLVRDDGSHCGGISAGCLEETIAETSIDCLNKGENRILEIDTRPFFGCFGQITVLFERLTDRPRALDLFTQIDRLIAARSTFQLLTDYADLSAGSLTRLGVEEDAQRERLLVETVTPVPRVLVFGDWPDGQAVTDLSRRMGWEVHPLDASGPGFDVAAVLDRLQPDNMTAAIVMTHNFARDLACLMQLLPRKAAYVGLIGSRKRREEISDALIDRGGTGLLDMLEKLHCPAGLDLGGDGHEAVALAVVAEIQSVLRGGGGKPLREKKAAVHANE